MSIKAKTIAFSVAAFLAAAGGLYTLMPGGDDNAANGPETADSAKPHVAAAGATPQAQSNTSPDVKGATAVAAPQPAAADQTASPVPKKLTQQQLTPPPATEEEKLQKAAEQESNF